MANSRPRIAETFRGNAGSETPRDSTPGGWGRAHASLAGRSYSLPGRWQTKQALTWGIEQEEKVKAMGIDKMQPRPSRGDAA